MRLFACPEARHALRADVIGSVRCDGSGLPDDWEKKDIARLSSNEVEWRSGASHLMFASVAGRMVTENTFCSTVLWESNRKAKRMEIDTDGFVPAGGAC